MLSTELPYDPAVPLLVIYPKEIKTYIYIKIDMWVLIVALGVTVIARKRKERNVQPMTK